MSKSIPRKIFFWTLVVVYFIITPTIIAYSFGYRYSDERGIFIYSGSLTIKPNPVKVSIHVNGEPTPKRKLNYLNNSYHIDSLRPDTYAVSVNAPGYATWNKEISVHSGISTEFWNVLLPKLDPEITEYSTPNIRKFFPAPESALYVFTSQDESVFTIQTLDTKTDTVTHLFSTNAYTYTDELYKNIEWSPESEAIIVPLASAKKMIQEDGSAPTLLQTKRTYAIINRESFNAIFLDELYPNTPTTAVRWSPKEKNVIYFLSDNNLLRVNITDDTIPELLISDVAAYDFSEDLILTTHSKSGIISSHPINDISQSQQISTTSIHNIDRCKDSCRLIGYDNKRIAFINENGDLYLYNKGEKQAYPLQHINSNVDGIQFSNDGKKLLYWTKHEIYVHFLRDWEAQPYRNENDTHHVARFFSPLSKVHWSKEFEHVIFLLNNSIQIIELDHRDKNNMFTLATLTTDSSEVFSDFRDEKLYFTDTIDDNCCSQLYSIDFPEKTGLLNL